MKTAKKFMIAIAIVTGLAMLIAYHSQGGIWN